MLPNGIWGSPLTDKSGIVNPDSVWGKYLTFLPALTESVLFIEVTHSQRGLTSAASYNEGSLLLESDRELLYIAVSGQWFYALGILSMLQQDLPNLATTLGANDKGLRVNVTDFAHELNWTGTGWMFAPADSGSGYYVPFLATPGTGWYPMDGTGSLGLANVPSLNGDGTLSFSTLPSTPGSFFRQ